MAGSVSGVATRIPSLSSSSIHPCFSPKLYLVIINACQVQAVRNALGTMSKVALFFENSPKRQAALEENFETEQPNKKRHLLNLCRTRIHQHEAFENLLNCMKLSICWKIFALHIESRYAH